MSQAATTYFANQKKMRDLPFYLLFVLIISTSLLTAYLGVSSYLSSRQFNEIRDRGIKIDQLREEIAQLEEALTLAAEMTTATGDLQWRERFEQLALKLEAAIEKFSLTSPGINISNKSDARKRISALWKECFELIREGKNQRALDLINSPQYEDAKTQHSQEIIEINATVNQSAEQEKNRHEAKLKDSAGASLIALLLTIVGWGFVFSSLKKWSQEIMALNVTLQSEAAQKATLLFESARTYKLGEMAGGISHEIINPLAVIVGKSALMRRKISTNEEINRDKVQLDLKKIEVNANRISKIIKQLRAFARSADKETMEPTPISQIIEDTLELCKGRFYNHSINLQVALPIDPELQIEAKSLQLSQVLLNLLGNSYDAVEELNEKWIKLNVNKCEDRVEISVTDSGRGIPQEIRSKIMTPFFSTKITGKRIGLSLSLSNDIVIQHNGQLYYDESSANTRFVIALPIVRDTIPLLPHEKEAA